MIKRIGIWIVLFSVCALAQGSGTPSQLRVKVDANGYLLASGIAGQTTPITTTVFTNARLRTDANGYLLVSIVGGTTAQDKFCLDATNKDIYIARQAANAFGFYTGASACASGTLKVVINATGLGIGGAPSFLFHAYGSANDFGTILSRIENTNTGSGAYAAFDLTAGSNNIRAYTPSQNVALQEAFFGTNGTLALNFMIGNAAYWQITGGGVACANCGHLIPYTTGISDLGSTSKVVRTGYFGTSIVNTNPTNGQAITALQTLTELTTIAAAATTDTTIQMPANSVVLGVAVRVTTVIPTATTFTVGDSGSAARFSTAAVSTAVNSTNSGTKAGAYYNASALSVRITPDMTPANNTGRVRVVIYYYTVTPPTS